MAYTITKSVSTEVEVDIEIDIDDIYEIIEEISSKQKKELMNFLKENDSELGYEIKSLDDELRHAILVEAYKKYDIFELEKRLK